MLNITGQRGRTDLSGRMTDRFTIGFYVVGVGLLLLAGKAWYGATKSADEPTRYLAASDAFDFDAIRASEGFRSYGPPALREPGHILAIFTMPANPCLDCMNEVHAFRALFQQRGFSGKPVQAEIVVVGDDLVAAKRFAKTNDFEQEVLYGSDQAYNRLLQSFGQTVVTHQMMLVDPDEGRIFFRARLALGLRSPPEVREKILWEAHNAYEALLSKTTQTNSGG